MRNLQEKLDDDLGPNQCLHRPPVDARSNAGLGGDRWFWAFGLATLSGILYFLGFVGFDQWYLAWVALVPLLVALSRAQSLTRALMLSWWMGLIAHLGGYHWLIHLLTTFAQFSWPLAALGWFLLCLAQGAIFAVWGTLSWLMHRRAGIALGWIAPVALIATEFAFPLLFPSYVANSQAFVPYVTQVAELGGVLFLSGIIVLVNAAVAQLIIARLEKRQLPWPLVVTALVSVVLTVTYSAIRIKQVENRDRAAPHLKIGIVQANVGAAEKHLSVEHGIERWRKMSDVALQTPGIGLLVWAESALNRLIVAEKTNLTGQVASEVTVPMIVGSLRSERDGRRLHVWNSIFSVAPGGKVQNYYDKIQLLIFGEYVPGYETFPGFYRWLEKTQILPYLFVYDRGTSLAPLTVGQYSISANICYEDILPRHIRDLMGPIDAAGTRPQAMVNATNDSWYGPVEPRIHLALATFRAIEHRRWLIRSTATGISAFIDSAGRVVKRSGFETQETLVQDVPMISAGPTVYGIIGDALGWIALVCCLAAIAKGRLSPTTAFFQGRNFFIGHRL